MEKKEKTMPGLRISLGPRKTKLQGYWFLIKMKEEQKPLLRSKKDRKPTKTGRSKRLTGSTQQG